MGVRVRQGGERAYARVFALFWNKKPKNIASFIFRLFEGAIKFASFIFAFFKEPKILGSCFSAFFMEPKILDVLEP